jgi:peptidoglycan/xylan/chitin deacetylase (PgdA/CDA1 family)
MPSASVLRAASFLLATSIVLAACGGGQSAISVSVDGKHESLAAGATLVQARSSLQLQPKAGSLLDVEGKVLRAAAFPGHVLVNGKRMAGSTVLRAGDWITLVAGRDRTESTRTRRLPVKGGILANPQFTLARSPGVQIVVRGAISRKLVSARFEAAPGRARVERAVALSFDDGPWPSATPGILRVLKRLHAPATFFCIGYLADAYPQLVRSELEAGMTVGNHSYNHPEVPPFASLPAPLLRDEIALGARSLERAGTRPRLLRPPGGSVSPALLKVASRAGERVVLWSVDPKDWVAGVTAKQIARRVLTAVRPGSIVELHDGGGNRNATIRALPAIIKGIRRKGLRLVAIPPS